MASGEAHFAQHLASNEPKVRNKALRRLQKWIRLRSQSKANEFTEKGMTKLWKGLFYCMWMADKPLVQEELADNISALIHTFAKPSQSYLFMTEFFRIMGRNHDNVDKFRIDKFLMLTRRFFRTSLQYLRKKEWAHKHVQQYLAVMRETVCSQEHNPSEMALGFRLHFYDIFLEELARVGGGELPQKRAHNFLEPLYEVLAYCKSPMVVEGVRDKIFKEFLQLTAAALDADAEEEDEDEDGEEVNGGDFIEDEADLDEDAVDSDGDGCEVSEDEDEERMAKRRKTDNGFINDDEDSDKENGDDSNAQDEGDLEEELIKAQESAADALDLEPIDFDLSIIRNSLKAYMKMQGLKSINKRAIEYLYKRIIDIEGGVNPFKIPEADSGSDLELDEVELKRAEKRLKLLENKYAAEAEDNLIPENDQALEDFEDEEEFEVA